MNIKEDLKILQESKDRIKSSKTIKKMFKEEGIPLSIIDVVPMCFCDLEVSARTEHGIIYFNKKLRNNSKEIDHYMVHEITHIIQQCFSKGPTEGSTNETYLDNPYEQEGFQNQTKFISEVKGDDAAEEYIDKVLDHHDVPDSEKEDKKDALMSTSSFKSNTIRKEFLKKELLSTNNIVIKIEDLY